MLSMKGIGYSVQENVINFSMEKFLVQIQSGVIYISMTIVKGKKNYQKPNVIVNIHGKDEVIIHCFNIYSSILESD